MLVDYSDSDSDSEPQQKKASSPPPSSSPPPAKKPGLSGLLPKPKNRKLVKDSDSGDGPKKLVVNLPKVAESEDIQDGPPAKKPRTGGGGGSGLSAMLPAPKRSGPAKRMLGSATAPAPPREADIPGGDDDDAPVVALEESEPKKTTGSSTMFIPQSLARKPILPGSSFKKASGTAKPAVAKPKVSLFGSGSSLQYSKSHMSKASKITPAAEYKPIMLTAVKPASKPTEASPNTLEEDADFNVGGGDSAAAGYQTTTSQTTPGVQDLDTMAREAGLDEAAMRQLYGRNGRHKGSQVNITTFSVDEEYNNNEHMRSLGLAQEAKPVRSIAPGKHQLSSLLNAAQSQKGALEESFAQGRRNKKEAGSKYGW